MTTIITDSQWEKISVFLTIYPKIRQGREKEFRQFLEAMLWFARTGLPWRLVPAEFGKRTTIYRRFSRWRANGILKRLIEFCDSDEELRGLFDRTALIVKRRNPGDLTRKISPSDLKEIKKRIRKGESVFAFADEYDVVPATIYNWLRKDKFRLPPRSADAAAQKLSSNDLEKIKKRIANGEKVLAVAAEYNVVPATVFSRLRRDKSILPASAGNAISREKLEELYVVRNLSVSGIQKLTGHPTRTIYDALAYYGFPKRRAAADSPSSRSIRNRRKKVDIERDSLTDLYIDKNKKIHELAVYFDCSEITINRYLRKYGIWKFK